MIKNLLILFIILSFTATATGQINRTAPTPVNEVVKVLRYYPNPATTVINFEFEKDYDKTYSLQIYSFIGKKVFEQKNVQPKTTINLTDFYRGVYIFQLRDAGGKIIESGKFQVIK